MKLMLILAAAGLIATPYALVQEQLWLAGVFAVYAVVVSMSYRLKKRALNRKP